MKKWPQKTERYSEDFYFTPIYHICKDTKILRQVISSKIGPMEKDVINANQSRSTFLVKKKKKDRWMDLQVMWEIIASQIQFHSKF